MNFKNKIVNDLAWVIGSVPLMSFNPEVNRYHELDQKWFYDEFQRCHGFLLDLDRNPHTLEGFVNSEIKGRQLLGKRFEKFIEFWLRESGRFEILISNHQIKESNRTVGEVDFVAKELSSSRLYHFEVACKYYLSSKNSKMWTNWVGLNAKDTLADKMEKFQKQLTIFDTKSGKNFLQEIKLERPKSYLLMKGYFFYYWKEVARPNIPKSANPYHNTGIYVKQNESKEFFSGTNSWKILKKKNWFSPFVSSSLQDLMPEYIISGRVSELIAEFKSSVMLARMVEDNSHWVEDLRVIITPKSWPNKTYN